MERKLGLLSLLDEESRFPKGTDQSLLSKWHASHGTNSYYVKPRIVNEYFGISHYAGEVSPLASIPSPTRKLHTNICDTPMHTGTLTVTY